MATKMQQPGRALGLSTMASTFGGVFSTICLILLAPQLAKVALQFSKPEYFALAIFGLSIITSIYALYGKKTVLLGFDLRKPKLFQEFGLNNNIGLSTYLSNKDTLDGVIQASGKIPNLDIITSGPIPPNPAELIASDKCNELFDKLKEIYDYIIIDTPPLGLVTDAFLLMRHSDVNLYIVRQGVTNKNIFGSIIKDIESRDIKVNIILNGIKQEGGYGYHYGSYKYGYSYAYSYGYGRYGKHDGSYYGEESGDKKHKKRK